MQSQVNWCYPCLLFLAIGLAVLSADAWWDGPISNQLKRRLHLAGVSVSAHPNDSSSNPSNTSTPANSASGSNSLFKLGTTEANQRGVAMVLASAAPNKRNPNPVPVETLATNPLQPLSESPLILESPTASAVKANSLTENHGAPGLQPHEAFVFRFVSVSSQNSSIPQIQPAIEAITRRLKSVDQVEPQVVSPNQSESAGTSVIPVGNDLSGGTSPSANVGDSPTAAATAAPNDIPNRDKGADDTAHSDALAHYQFVSWSASTGEQEPQTDSTLPGSRRTPAAGTNFSDPPAANDSFPPLKSPVILKSNAPLIQVIPLTDSESSDESTPPVGMLQPKLTAPAAAPMNETRSEDKAKVPADEPSQSHLDRSAPTRDSDSKIAAQPASTKKALPVWPEPVALQPHWEPLSAVPEFLPWLEECQGTLAELGRQTSLDSPQVEDLLAHLEYLIGLMEPMIVFKSTLAVESAEQAQGEVATTLRRVRYLLQQRVEIWRAASRVAAAEIASISDQPSQNRIPAIQVSTQRMTVSNLPAEWQTYILLPELESVFNQTSADENARRNLARRVLGRISSPILTPQQQNYLAAQLDPQWIESLQSTARGPVDLPDLLRNIELLQKTGSGLAATKVNHQFQNLLWNDSPVYYSLAETIDTHFRNANLRLSISDELLNLMLPDTPDVHEPVNENILGANVRGHSRIANRLRVKLLPDASQIKMRLESIGQVDSATQASRSGFVVENQGTARFQAFKQIVINRHGILTDRPQAVSSSDNQIVGMRSNFDGMPIIGWVARRVAQQQIDAQSGQAESIVKHKLESTVKQRFDSEIEQQLDQLQNSMSAGLIQPLVALDLEPTPLELRTTEDRVVMRYRLAGVDQMAADSARPRGLQASLFSMQIHESAINNLLNRIELNGRQFTAVELSQHLAQVFGTEDLTSSDIRDVDAILEFAPYDPIRISMRHDDIRIELNLRKFQIGKGKVYKNLRVTARYVPTVQGSQLLLVQDDSGISLESRYLEFRDQLAVRPVFNSLFKLRYQVDLVPAHLAARSQHPLTLSQFEVTGGWLGMSIDYVMPPATQPARQTRLPLLSR